MEIEKVEKKSKKNRKKIVEQKKRQIPKKQAIMIARELFLTEVNGKHAYSLQEIKEELDRRGYTVGTTTIHDWVERYGWKQEWEEKVLEGASKALQELKQGLAKDEEQKQKLLERLEKFHEENFKALYSLKLKIFNRLLEEEDIAKILSPSEMIKLLSLILEYEGEIESKLRVKLEGEKDFIICWGDGTEA